MLHGMKRDAVPPFKSGPPSILGLPSNSGLQGFPFQLLNITYHPLKQFEWRDRWETIGFDQPYKQTESNILSTLLFFRTYPVTHPEFFWGRLIHTSNPLRHHHGWSQADKFSKFVPPDTLKMLSKALPVLRSLCKTFPKLLKVIFWKTLFL